MPCRVHRLDEGGPERILGLCEDANLSWFQLLQSDNMSRVRFLLTQAHLSDHQAGAERTEALVFLQNSRSA